MNFSELRDKPSLIKRFLRTKEDWLVEEKAFRAKLPEFHAAIEAGNPIVAQSCESIKNLQEQVVCDEEVPGTTKEKSPAVQDQGHEFVESVRVGAPNCGDSATRPPQPALRSTEMDTSPDPLDELFAEPPKPAPKPKQSKAEPPKAQEEDIFAAASAPPHAATESFATEVSKPAKSLPESEDGVGTLDGFNMKEFAEVQAVINGILKKVDKADLDSITKTLPEYAVRLDLDHNRENPAILSDRISQVQAKLDSLHALMMKVGPEAQAIGQAWDYLTDVGVAFSNASNREKRAAQAKLVMKDLWQRFVLVKAVHASLEKSYKHLQMQFDTLSRLITCSQERSREVARGALPYESNELAATISREVSSQLSAQLSKMMQPNPAASKIADAPASHAKSKPKSNEELEFLNEEMAQPLSTKGLDDFPKGIKVPPKKDKGFVDF